MCAASEKPKHVVKTKKELADMLGTLYTELSWKGSQAADSLNWQYDKERAFQQYAEMKTMVQDIIGKLVFAGGFE